MYKPPKDKSNSIGANYIYVEERQYDYDYRDLWLCNVTKFIFGEFPKFIYIKSIK